MASIILNITMPDLGGVETFRRLRAMDGQVKVFITSGYPLSPAIREIEGKAIVSVIPKPSNPQKLSLTIW